MTHTHPFDSATEITQTGHGAYTAHTSETYGNMVGPFGGVTSATLMRAVLSDERLSGDPVSMTVNFCAAIKNGDYQITTDLRRAGKYIQHWSLEITQNGQICTTASLVFGVRAEGFSHHSGVPPMAKAFDQCAVEPDLGFANWLKCYEFRYAEGAPDMTGRAVGDLGPARSVAWITDQPARDLDLLSLTAMSDSFLLRLPHVRASFVPMGTVSLTTHFLATPDDIAEQGQHPVLGVSDATRFHHNFHDQHMQLWSHTGKLLATGSQIAWFKH